MVYIYGASGHGKVICEIAESIDISVGGFIDANPSLTSMLDYPVTQHIPNSCDSLVIAIGNNTIRKKISLSHPQYTYLILIHPAANISKRSEIGQGTVIMAGATINADVQIGQHCIINTNASVDHDCYIGDYVHISPNVALAGGVKVGEGTHIGIGASVIQCLNIGKNCIVGAGAVVITDIPDNAIVVGNPAKIIKYNSH